MHDASLVVLENVFSENAKDVFDKFFKMFGNWWRRQSVNLCLVSTQVFMKIVIFVRSHRIIRLWYWIMNYDIISIKDKCIKVYVSFIAHFKVVPSIYCTHFYCRHKDDIVSDVMELSTDVTSIVGEILLVLLQRFHLNIVPLLKPLHGLFYGLGLHVKFNCLDKDLM